MPREQIRVRLFDEDAYATRSDPDHRQAPATGDMGNYGLLWDYLEAFKRNLRRPMTRDVGLLIMNFVQANIAHNFARQQDSFGDDWAELAYSTQMARKKAGYGGSEPKLIGGGSLYKEATSGLTMELAGESVSIKPRIRGTNFHKWSAHNRPASDYLNIMQGEKTIRIPGREFFYVDQGATQTIAMTILGAIHGDATRIAKGSAKKPGTLANEITSLRGLNEHMTRGFGRTRPIPFPWAGSGAKGSSAGRIR